MKKTLAEKLCAIDNAGLRRALKTAESFPGKEICFDGKQFLNFSSNNYLGLAMHPRVRRAAARAVEEFGAGGTSSRLLGGSLAVHQELEKKLADFKHAESALVFPSGYQANVGIVSTLIGSGDCVIMDQLNHASLWDGAKLSGARIFVYRHADSNSLETVLKRAEKYARKLVITDSVFSMDGDCAPLAEIAALARQYGAWSMIDEAHATGVFGKTGAGLAEECGVEGMIDIVMGTLSKALGSQGGFICGPRELTDYIVNRGRPFIYSTSLAPAACAAALEAINIIREEPERRTKLLDMARYLRQKLGAPPAGFVSPIIAHIIGPVDATTRTAQHLWDNGIYAPAIRPPTVPEGECRLRFSLTSDHSIADIDTLMSVILLSHS
ncbi:MAG: 8-amino-7-oxononanoate synthase [Elusimicrobia bacterium]|nr:8-amino-7-oxononanoate synthase [Elusimicrobiota bacterium]